jgi:hypothetical protein
MDTFDLWTKQNIIDIIFHFNKKNYELLRNFIKWYDIEDNYMYILSTRYFYSNECLKLLLSTINAFIDVKNNDISEEVVIHELELEKENNIKKDLVIDELAKEINIKEELVVDELEKKNDSDEYVINDDYYFTKEENVEKDDVVEDNDDEDNDVVEDDVVEDNDVEDNDVVEDDVVEDDVEEDDVEEDDVVEDDIEEDNVVKDDAKDSDVMMDGFSNNEIILLLNILEEDTKKFSKHNYIIGKFKEELFFYNNFYLGFTTGILVYFLLKLF